jgi:Kef-type K+ transport system membrane component KefB
MLGKTELILICLVVVALLAIVARKIRIPYPILLTIGGVLLALVPGLPAIHLDPQLVFNLFLPPLIYPAAVWTSWRDFRANLWPILLLAIVLVLITMTATAAVFHSTAGLPLAVCFVFGALISPPDAVAALSVTQNLRVPRKIIVILEGESLVNDATSFIAFRFAVAAAMTGSFSNRARELAISFCGRRRNLRRSRRWLVGNAIAKASRRSARANNVLPADSVRPNATTGGPRLGNGFVRSQRNSFYARWSATAAGHRSRPAERASRNTCLRSPLRECLRRVTFRR